MSSKCKKVTKKGLKIDFEKNLVTPFSPLNSYQLILAVKMARFFNDKVMKPANTGQLLLQNIFASRQLYEHYLSVDYCRLLGEHPVLSAYGLRDHLHLI